MDSSVLRSPRAGRAYSPGARSLKTVRHPRDASLSGSRRYNGSYDVHDDRDHLAVSYKSYKRHSRNSVLPHESMRSGRDRYTPSSSTRSRRDPNGNSRKHRVAWEDEVVASSQSLRRSSSSNIIPNGSTNGHTRATYGSANPAIRELEEMHEILSQRMKTAENTARALMGAKETINAESMLAKARSEAENWARSGSGAASASLSSLSPDGIHRLVAERNELRYQLHKAEAELRKIELASGGNSIDIVKLCLNDMERIARLKARIERDQDSLVTKNITIKENLHQSHQHREAEELQVGTLQEQLAERDATILRLNDLLESCRSELAVTIEKDRDTLDKSLREQKDRLEERLNQERLAAIQNTEARCRSEKFQELDDLRKELENRHGNILDTKLAEQKHALLTQLGNEKADELQSLQSELYHREAANMQQLRNNLNSDHERAMRALERQHATVKDRMQREIDNAQSIADARFERAVVDNEGKLRKEHDFELRAALEKLEASLKGKHAVELEELRNTLVARHKAELESTLQKNLEAQKKSMKSQHNREMHTALQNLKQEHAAKFAAAKKSQFDTLTTKHKQEFSTKLKTDLKEEKRRWMAQSKREQTAQMEKYMLQMKTEKTNEIAQIKSRMKEQAKKDKSDLVSKVEKLQAEISKLKQAAHEAANEEQQRKTRQKTSYNALREALRGVLNAMKLALTPRLEATLDADMKISPSYAKLHSLINALLKNQISHQPKPSIAASHAPLVSVDVLIAVALELCDYLNSANHQVESSETQLERERKTIRMQLEEEFAEERRMELEALRETMLQERDAEIENNLQALQFEHTKELNRERQDFEDRIHEIELKAAARQHEQADVFKQQLDDERVHAAEVSSKAKRSTKAKSSEASHLKQQVEALERERESNQNKIYHLENSVQELQQEIIHLNRESKKRPATHGSSQPSSTAAKPSAELDSAKREIKRLREEHTVLEKERLRLQLAISNFYDNEH